MGLCRYYLGEVNLPKEKRQTYAEQALKLLRAGGMVTVEPVQLYGHKLYLLSLPELDEEGKLTMRTLARNMSFLIKSIALGKEAYGLPAQEQRVATNFIR